MWLTRNPSIPPTHLSLFFGSCERKNIYTKRQARVYEQISAGNTNAEYQMSKRCNNFSSGNEFMERRKKIFLLSHRIRDYMGQR